MQIIKRIAPLVLLGALGLCFSATASAGGPYVAPSAMPLSNGFYGEANFGYGFTDSTSRRRDSGIAGGFALGYKFLPYLAVDVGYTQTPRVFVSSYFIHGAVKGILPLGDGSWDVFAKAGAAYARGQRIANVEPHTAGVFYYGLGFTHWFQQDFGVILQGTGTLRNGNVPAMYTGTVGLTYFF